MTHFPWVAAFIVFAGTVIGAQCGHPLWGFIGGIAAVIAMVEFHWRH